MATILVIEDEENIRFAVKRSLSKRGHEVVEAGSVADGLAASDQFDFDLIVTDLHLPDGDGISVVESLRGRGFEGGLVVMTAFATIESAVSAMKLGADEYLQKPVSLDELALIVERLLERKSDRKRLLLHERQTRQEADRDRPIGQSANWLAVLSLGERLAGAPLMTRSGAGEVGALTTALVLGETGTGKSVLARHIHRKGALNPEKDPFVHVNCSTLPAQLVESELFGHEKGAFTDAREARQGLVELADEGTLFLDEIGDMPIEMQAKLLLFLETGRFRRVGGTRERSVRCRVIVATNHDLDAESQRGEFRRDLLYRINGFTIEAPPLRERGEDVLLIARQMLGRLCADYGREACRLSPAAERLLLSHTWPGNVRELINVIQRAAMLCDSDVVTPADLALDHRAAPSMPVHSASAASLRFDFDAGAHRADEVEKELMLQALERTGGNVSKAARLIGMQRSSFRYRIERYGMEEAVREIAER